MRELWNVTQLVLAATGGVVGWFLGGCDGHLYTLIAFVVLDYLTGVMVAIVAKKFYSSVGFKGIFKKILIFLLVGMGHLLDAQVATDVSGFLPNNLLAAAAGGSLTFVQEETELPIPNSVDYLIKL